MDFSLMFAISELAQYELEVRSNTGGDKRGTLRMHYYSIDETTNYL